MIKNKIAVVCYEDRPTHDTGLTLLILSVLRHHDDVDLHVFTPKATEPLIRWCTNKRLTLHNKAPSIQKSFNIKPDLLTWALNAGYQRAVFLDSDLLLTRALPTVMLNSDPSVFVAAELSPLSKVRTRVRTDHWQLQLARSFVRDPSGCCLSVSVHHRALLAQWIKLIESPDYQHAQELRKTNPYELPTALRGDDELLIALLGSTLFSQLPVRLLSSTYQIAQCGSAGGFTVYARIRALFLGMPHIVHAVAKKPWLNEGSAYRSPYAVYARNFKSKLEEDSRWMDLPPLVRGRWVRMLYNHPALADLSGAAHDQFSRCGLRRFFFCIKYYFLEKLNY